MPIEIVEELVDELEEAARPVQLAAQAKSPTTMSGMGRPTESNRAWSAMRVGIARRNPAEVYVVPQLRRGRRKQSQRQKEVWAERMQTRALDPALKENEDKVVDRVEDLLDRIAIHNGF